jgi:hypothetical protein
VALHDDLEVVNPNTPIVGGTPGAMRVWFHRLYEGMGYAALSTTQGYIDENKYAKRKVVDM